MSDRNSASRKDAKPVAASKIPCCPEIAKDPCCDRLEFTYRLQYDLGAAPVEIALVFELERCPGELSLGDIVYSTTLLPGEKRRLYTNNRNNRFTYDSEREVSYRHENTSEETFFMSSMHDAMSNLTVTDQSSGSASSESSADVSASASGAIETLLTGPEGRVSGRFSGKSSFDFMREVSRHAESSSKRSASATRAANSVSIGEVQSRTHAEGESESAFEASTRIIENKNQCHAVNYFAYQLEKKQTIRFSLKAVTRRVIDAAAPSGVTRRPLAPATDVAIIPSGLLATNKERVEFETQSRTGAFARKSQLIDRSILPQSAFTDTLSVFAGRTQTPVLEPLKDDVHEEALKTADQDLVKVGILQKVGGNLDPKFAAANGIGFEITTCLPTQAIMVKGCIDDCSVCEPERQKSIKLDLERKELENRLLERQIELLDKAQEYRCCPVDEIEVIEEEED